MKSAKQKKRKSLLDSFGIGHDRDYFIENLSMLVSSGMTIVEALDSITPDIRSKRMRESIGEIRESIESGSPLWRALDSVHLFPSHTVSLVRIGEESGKLSENLHVISLQQEKERVFQSKIRSAMMYPVFVLALTFVVGIGLAWFILPKLALVFSQLRLELPLITKVLIGAGVYLSRYGAIIVPGIIVALGLILYIIFYFPKTKIVGQTILFALPGIKLLILEVELSRLGYLLGTLLQAGLPITQAISSLAQATFFPYYKKFYTYLAKSIEDGNSFQKSFARYRRLNRIVPTPVQQLIVTSEKSGNLSEMLLKISETYEAKTETTTKNLTVILEPILLVIVWLGVVAVALAVILPIYNLIGGLNTAP
jgi:type IV pilus assembly protein PilC